MNQSLRMFTLQSERLRVRPWQRSDTLMQETWPKYSDPFHTLWNIPRKLSFHDDNFLHWSASIERRRIWAIEDYRQFLIGRISLRDIDQQAHQARLGISLGAPYVGQGLGSEALSVFLDYFFGPLHFRVMLLDVAAFNIRAVDCYTRLGFRTITPDWRSAGMDPCLRLLDEPQYSNLRPFFRRDRHSTFVQFLEMELYSSDWLTHTTR